MLGVKICVSRSGFDLNPVCVAVVGVKIHVCGIGWQFGCNFWIVITYAGGHISYSSQKNIGYVQLDIYIYIYLG